jgi:hypothetical protein
MIIGYSCWGFLGNGIVNTPDGGRSHRNTLVQGLMKRNNKVVMLQRNRDLIEAGDDFTTDSLFFSDGFPDIDALFIEYRWPIQRRNYGVSSTDPNYTPDLARQEELISYYSRKRIPIIVWDKDQKISDTVRESLVGRHLKVFEPALNPRPGRESLLFPNSIQNMQVAKRELSQYNKHRANTLVYIGNRYERDASFEKYISCPSELLATKTPVFGKWLDKSKDISEIFRSIDFRGRVGYKDVATIYKESFTTVLIAPDRYYQQKQYTQRLFESLWGLCIPLIPQEYGCDFLPPELVVGSSVDVVERIHFLRSQTDDYIRRLLSSTLESLVIFSPDRQVATVLGAISDIQEDCRRA